MTKPEEDPQILKAISSYHEKFGEDPDIVAYAPGRVNLIGEHTDYNDGFVLPFALPYRTVIVGSRNVKTKTSTIISLSQEASTCSFVINESLSKGEPFWANYVKGTIFQYLKEIDWKSGFALNALIVSNVPLGSGLSSSAALEVATATFLEGLLGGIKGSNGVDKALRCQKAEHTFADTPCGIMDQYISSMGSKGNLLLIDCRSKAYQLIPFGGVGSKSPLVLVTNSNVKHSLTGSEYPDRVKQCQKAVSVLKTKYPTVTALRDATMEMLDSVKDNLTDVEYNRAKHSIGEDIRTQATVEALKKKDFISVGKFMTQSHVSLQNDYEVSCPELDLLVTLANQVPGVYGSRMTGGGFGGCTVTLVDRDSVVTLEKFIYDNYLKQTGKQCVFYRTEPAEGAGYFKVSDLKNNNKSLKGINTSNNSDDSNRSSWIDWIVPVSVLALSAVVLMTTLRNKK